jgi:hypothetical protein
MGLIYNGVLISTFVRAVHFDTVLYANDTNWSYPDIAIIKRPNLFFLSGYDRSRDMHADYWSEPDSSVNILNASFVMTLQFSAISSRVQPSNLIFTGR